VPLEPAADWAVAGLAALVERSVWTLAVVVLDEDAQDMVELTRSQD